MSVSKGRHTSMLPIDIVQASIAFLLSLCCYLNSLSGELVHDDIFAVRDNQDLRPSTPIGQLLLDDFWGEPMTSPVSHKSYRPLTVLSFRLNFALHELEPWGYHVINVLLHGVATVLFGVVCREVVFKFREKKGEGLIFMATILFATHPVHTEAVTGIVGRADVLACIFFLLSLLLFHYSAAAPVTASRTSLPTILKLFLSLLLGAAAMLSKEHGATVLGVCMVYDVFVLNRKEIVRCVKGRRYFSRSLHPVFLRSSLLLLTVAILLGLRIWLLHGHLPHFSAHDNPASFADSLTTRVLTYCYLFFFNARLLVYPSTLCYDWQMGSIPLVETFSDVRNLSTFIFFLFLISLSFISLCGLGGRRDATLLGLCLLVVPFLPASNLFIRVGFVVAERILYIPSLGYCILVAMGIHSLSRKLSKSSGRLALCLTLIIVSVFSLKTVTRNRVWESRETLFRSGLATVPDNSKVHYNYANFLKDSERFEEAIRHYRVSIRLSPDHAQSHNNLGTLLDGKEAELHFREAVRHNPQHHKAFYNLGRNLENQGRNIEAEQAFNRSIELKPGYTDALMSMATLLGDAGRLEEGLKFIQKAVAAGSDNPDVYNNYAAYLLRLDRNGDAIASYQKAISLDPGHTTAMTSLARVYRSIGENEKAEKLFKRSNSLRPDADTLHHLASFYHNTGKLTDAKTTFKEALSLNPQRTETACALAQTLMLLDQFDEALSVLQETVNRRLGASSCVQLNLASVYLHQKNLKKALEHSEAAVELCTSNETKSDAYHVRGSVLKDLGRMEEAESSFQTAVMYNPRKSASRLNLGAMLHIKKDYVAARREYEAALKLDPTNQLILDNLKKLDRLERTSKSSR